LQINNARHETFLLKSKKSSKIAIAAPCTKPLIYQAKLACVSKCEIPDSYLLTGLSQVKHSCD